MPIASSLLNKPRLVKKLKAFYDYVQKNDGKVGTKTRGIDLNFNNACNLRCKYCFTNSPKGDHVKEYLDIGAIKRLADEADELGYFEFDLQGGELLLQPKKLFEVCRLRDMPIATFINKMDRESKDPFDLIDEIEQTLQIDVCPVSWPIGMGNRFLGCYDLIKDQLILIFPTVH